MHLCCFTSAKAQILTHLLALIFGLATRQKTLFAAQRVVKHKGATVSQRHDGNPPSARPITVDMHLVSSSLRLPVGPALVVADLKAALLASNGRSYRLTYADIC